MATSEEGSPAKWAGALHAGLSALEVLIANPAGIGITDIAAQLGADKGNVHRTLRSLEDRNYVEQDPRTKLYLPSRALFALAGTCLREQNLSVVARPFMLALSAESGVPVHLARRLQKGGVYIAREGHSPSGVSIQTQIGAEPPIHASATGKALYLLTTPEELGTVLPERLPLFTEKTIRTRDELWDNISRSRRLGFCSDKEELNIGVSCVAAPILDFTGAVAGSIGVSYLVSALEDSELEHWGRRVAAIAGEITIRMGGKPLNSLTSQEN